MGTTTHDLEKRIAAAITGNSSVEELASLIEEMEAQIILLEAEIITERERELDVLVLDLRPRIRLPRLLRWHASGCRLLCLASNRDTLRH